MTNPAFIFIEPDFNYSAFSNYLKDNGKKHDEIQSILSSLKELKTFKWKGERETIMTQCAKAMDSVDLYRLLQPSSKLNHRKKLEYARALIEYIKFFQCKGEQTNIVNSKQQKKRPLIPSLTNNSETLIKKILESHQKEQEKREKGFRILYNPEIEEESFADYLLYERHIDALYVKRIVRDMEEVAQKQWKHTNKSYKTFKWNPPDIDKYLDGIFPVGSTHKSFIGLESHRYKRAMRWIIQYKQSLINKDKEIIGTSPNQAMSNSESEILPKLRIVLDLADVDDFFHFLKYRPINYQTRERYIEPINVKVEQKTKARRKTYVAKGVSFNKDGVEVIVNGELSSDVVCKVEETADAYILHLFYKEEREYSKNLSIDKDKSKEPLRRIRFSDSGGCVQVNGKNLAVTFEGYDAYRRKREHKIVKERQDSTIIYEGNPKREKQTAISRQTSVTTTDEVVNVKIEDCLNGNITPNTIESKDDDMNTCPNKYKVNNINTESNDEGNAVPSIMINPPIEQNNVTKSLNLTEEGVTTAPKQSEEKGEDIIGNIMLAKEEKQPTPNDCYNEIHKQLKEIQGFVIRFWTMIVSFFRSK